MSEGTAPAATTSTRSSTLVTTGIALARAAGALGVLALLGWQMDWPFLRNLGQPASMNPLTAFLFILCWLVVELLPCDPDRPARIPQLIGMGIMLVSALKLLSFFGLRFQLDRLLFHAHLDSGAFPNQVAPSTAVAFMLLGIKLVLLCGRPRLSSSLPQILALLTAYIGFQSLVSYLFGIGGTLEVGSIIPMALNSAIGIVVISLSLLLLDSHTGLIAELTRHFAGGALARRSLPFAIILPVAIGWFRLQGQQSGLYASEVGVTLMITAMVICLVAAIWWNARQLNRADAHVHEILRDLERINHELETFSYSVSHDLRAPLRSIAGFSHILLNEHSGKLDAEALDYLKRISNASERMGRLIDGLLNLSRLSRKAIRHETVDLTQIAEIAVVDLRSGTPERQVDVHLQPKVTASGDPDLLALVIQNLIGNAWKFTSRKTGARIEFATVLTQHGRAYYVRDNGAGFDMKHARNLFGAFQRMHSLAEFEGTGIGLATVQRIIHRHGGTVWAEAEPGNGATFYFTLRNTASRKENSHGAT